MSPRHFVLQVEDEVEHHVEHWTSKSTTMIPCLLKKIRLPDAPTHQLEEVYR